MFDTRKTRMIVLPGGGEIMTICEAVSIKYRNVMDGQTDRQNCYVNIAHQFVDA